MKKSLMVTVIALGAFTLVGTIAHADSTAQARKQIQADYNSQNAAMSRKDLKGTLAHTDPAFVGQGFSGTPQTYKMRAASLPLLFKGTKSLMIKSRIEKFVLKGNTANVQIKANTVVTAVDPQSGNLKTVPGFSTSTDMWVKRSSGWMLLRTHVTDMKVIRK